MRTIFCWSFGIVFWKCIAGWWYCSCCSSTAWSDRNCEHPTTTQGQYWGSWQLGTSFDLWASFWSRVGCGQCINNKEMHLYKRIWMQLWMWDCIVFHGCSHKHCECSEIWDVLNAGQWCHQKVGMLLGTENAQSNTVMKSHLSMFWLYSSFYTI